MHPGDIGPYESADRVWTAVAGGRSIWCCSLRGDSRRQSGLYRLAVKWGWFEGDDPTRTRVLLKRLKWGITLFFLALGLLTLAAYMKIGYEHRHRVGERYVPTHLQSLTPSGQKR